MNDQKPKISAVPSTSATAEIVTTSAPNIFFNGDDDGSNKKQDRRLGDRSSLNGRAASGENVNMLNVGYFSGFLIISFVQLFSPNFYPRTVCVCFEKQWKISCSLRFLSKCFYKDVICERRSVTSSLSV